MQNTALPNRPFYIFTMAARHVRSDDKHARFGDGRAAFGNAPNRFENYVQPASFSIISA